MEVIMKLDLLIISEISKNLTKKWSINELSHAIDKHYKPIYLAVQRLIDQNYLEKNSNNLIQPVYKDTTLLELSEKARLANCKNKDITIISRKFKKSTPFSSAVLFGSSVYKKGRDIDILIIIPNSENIGSFDRKVKKILGSFYSKVDLNIISEESCYEMLNQPNELNVMNEIMKNHLVIVGHENFYAIIKRWKNA